MSSSSNIYLPTAGRDPSLAPRRLRAFGFAELKCATRGFIQGLMIGERGFRCIYRWVVDDGDDGAVDVAVKRSNRNGSQAGAIFIRLVSAVGIGFFYVKRKNPFKITEKLEFRKYDPRVNQHVLFTKAKIK